MLLWIVPMWLTVFIQPGSFIQRVEHSLDNLLWTLQFTEKLLFQQNSHYTMLNQMCTLMPVAQLIINFYDEKQEVIV